MNCFSEWLNSSAGVHCFDKMTTTSLGNVEIYNILELAFTAGQTSQAKEDREVARRQEEFLKSLKENKGGSQ